MSWGALLCELSGRCWHSCSIWQCKQPGRCGCDSSIDRQEQSHHASLLHMGEQLLLPAQPAPPSTPWRACTESARVSRCASAVSRRTTRYAELRIGRRMRALGLVKPWSRGGSGSADASSAAPTPCEVAASRSSREGRCRGGVWHVVVVLVV